MLLLDLFDFLILFLDSAASEVFEKVFFFLVDPASVEFGRDQADFNSQGSSSSSSRRGGGGRILILLEDIVVLSPLSIFCGLLSLLAELLGS